MATWLSGFSQQHRTIRKNAVIWCILLGGILLLIIGRLFWLQVIKHAYYQRQADMYHKRQDVLPATRGRLLDCNGVVLALDDTRDSLYVDPELISNPALLAQQLAPVVQVPPDQLLATITQPVDFVWVKRDLSPTEVTALRACTLPGLTVREDGWRYRIGADPRLLPESDALVPELAQALGVTPQTVTTQLGIDVTPQQEHASSKEPVHQAAPVATSPVAPAQTTGTPPPHHTAATPATPPATPLRLRWLTAHFSPPHMLAVRALHFPGVAIVKAEKNYSLGVDPRGYLDGTSTLPADTAAAQLSLLIGMTPEAIERRLLYRTRFAWLRRGLSEEMSAAVRRLQGTFFVVEPGKVLSTPDPSEKHDTPGTRLDNAVDRLYAMSNPEPKPHKQGEPLEPVKELISKEEIRNRLQAGAAPGPLGPPPAAGKPSLRITRKMIAKPIPGVVYGLPGVGMQQERRRRYPYNTLASASLGFVAYFNGGFHGAFGLEQVEDNILQGKDGKEMREIDTRRMTIPERSERIEPVDGRDVVTTLDVNIQQTAEDELAKAVDSAHALRGACVVMNPENGEILAMATYPSWDANDPAAKKIPLVHTAVSNYYEPGSTYKTATVIAALEEGVTHDGQIITNCTGALPVGNHIIHDVHGAHGQVDAGALLEESCNIGAATLAMRLGPARFLKWCDNLGFGKRTGIELANESHGSLNRKNCERAKVTLANEGFGQSMAVTPLQMVALYSVAANGGYLVKPHLVKSWVRPDGTIEHVMPERKRVCKAETAVLLRRYLERVVSGKKGTGKAAAIPGYRIAGKTGTAQKAGPGGFRAGKYIGSFIGFMPVEKPRLTMVAIIDEPQGSHYGGVIAAPVVREVGKRTMELILRIPPSQPVKKPTTPAAPAH